jgi:hypothetical protein
MKIRVSLPRLALGLMLALGSSSTAFAQVGGPLCPVERIAASSPRPDQVLMPTISAYSVNAITDPVAERTRGETAARVVGGDEQRGWLRIDVTLSAPVAAGCTLPFAIVREGVTQDQVERPNSVELLRGIHEIFDGLDFENGLPVGAGSRDFERALNAAANGTDKIAMELPVQALVGTSPKMHRLLLMLGRSLADARPLQLTVDPLPPFSVRAIAAPVVGGPETTVQVDQATRLHAESRKMPLTFSVSAASLGQFREINRGVRAATASALWSMDFVPARATVIFVGGSVTEPTNGDIHVTYAGRSVSTPVTVLPGEVQCQPQFTTKAVSGGVDVTLSNGSTKACPRYNLRIVSPTGVTPNSAPLAVAARTAVSQSITGIATPSVLTGNTTPVAALTPTVARFRLAPGALATFTKISIDAEPLDASLPTVRLEFRPTSAELAIMRKQ